MMRRFLFSSDIRQVNGSQTFYIDAESIDAAKAELESGAGEIYSEQVEVTDLGVFEFDGEASLDDFGDFPPDQENPTYEDLVAENAALKKCCEAYDADGVAEYGDQWEVTPLETPATEAAIAEIKAMGVDEVVKFLGGLTSDECGDSAYIGTVNIVANLRAGRKG